MEGQKTSLTTNCAPQEQRKKTVPRAPEQFCAKQSEKILEHVLAHHSDFEQPNPVHNDTKPTLQNLLCKLKPAKQTITFKEQKKKNQNKRKSPNSEAWAAANNAVTTERVPGSEADGSRPSLCHQLF